MKHYDYIEWILYKKKLLDKQIYEEMEDHLYKCDDCLDIFLSLIDDEEIKIAEHIIPKGFTGNIMDKTKSIRPLKKKIKKRSQITNDFFIYYTAVASVTIILTAGGIFGKLVDGVPQITVNLPAQENRIMSNAIYELSEKITNRTSIFINDFQISKNRED